VAQEPRSETRAESHRLLDAAGWAVQDFKQADTHVEHGVPVREIGSDI